MLGLFSVVDALVTWLILIGLSAIVMIVVVVALVAMNRAKEFKPARVGTSDEGNGAVVTVIARRRILICMCGVVAIVMIALTSGGILRYGLNLALMPGVASCIVAGLIALPYADRHGVAAPESAEGVRVASLRSREPWTYARWYVLVQPIVVAALLVGYLIITSCMGTTDGDSAGRSIRLTGENAYGGVMSEASPFPGVYYAVPLIAITLLLVALTCAALWRISRTPAVPGGRGEEADRRWRAAMTKFVVFLSSGSMLAYAAGVLYFAGNATRLVGINFGALPPAYADDVYPTLGALQMIVGGLLGVLALVYLVMAVVAAVGLWTGARAIASRDAAPGNEQAESAWRKAGAR